MKRRDFLFTISAATFAKATLNAQASATILYDSRAVALARVDVDASGALWVQKKDLPRINGFEIKPQGACRADICIPLAKDMVHGEYMNLTAFARKIRQAVVADPAAHVWSFGEIEALRGSFLNGRVAPDVTVPDRKGRPVHLADFRGKKVLLVTWASW